MYPAAFCCSVTISVVGLFLVGSVLAGPPGQLPSLLLPDSAGSAASAAASAAGNVAGNAASASKAMGGFIKSLF